jgi:heterodisulfide reductase subunit A-like polyferredoxin
MTTPAGDKIGAVLVVGGGVGGMQASLDLAEAGYKVYLVEQASAIGGKMAQLDKTFPTNDCAMCTLAPRLVDAGAHLDVEKIAGATVESITGEPGRMRVEVRQQSRYVDLACTGCSLCVEKCPVRLDSEFDAGLVQRTAIYKRYPQAFPGALAIDKQGVSPCRTACPAGVNAHAYVSLVARGRYAEALAIERQGNPFAAMIGRICPHPCESACTRGGLDDGVAIRALKRFLADWEDADPGRKAPAPRVEQTRPEKVAVVGSGPAGLMAARELALLGYRVTILEAKELPGGMLQYGIPAYRLPKDVVAREIKEAVLDLGVELRTGTRLGIDVTIDELRASHAAVVLAIGAWSGARLGIPGESSYPTVIDAVPFLTAVNSGAPPEVAGKRVVVVGGGNSAIDAARSAVRLGAEVTILYRRTGAEMPAYPWEVEEAIEEGVHLSYLVAPVEALGTGGKLTGLACERMRLGEPDASGRPRPVAIPGSRFVVPADVIIAAIGQKTDATGLGQVRVDAKRSVVVADETTLETSLPGVFACGDAVLGPDMAVTAVATGRAAAISVDRYLRGEDLKAGRKAPERPKATRDLHGVPRRRRTPVRLLPLADRRAGFAESELGYGEEEALAEASRCLSCSGCCECELCVAACEKGVIHHDMPAEVHRTLEVGAVVLAPGFDVFDATARPEFGLGRYPNVVSSIQFERLMSASGPNQGVILRPSDRRHPKSVAFIQCVGSREAAHDYCSSVCCMYATKEAMIAKEHEPDLEACIFYIDVRAFGKGFEAYYQRARDAGVSYVRCRPYGVSEVPGSRNLAVSYHDDDGTLRSREFDLVVLSCGMVPARSAPDLARTFGLELNRHGFARTGGFHPVETTRPGVYACGPFVAPKDIPETVVDASAAAAQAMKLLAGARHTLTTRREFPPEMDVSGQEPRIGVFVCHCGKNIGGVADVPAVRDYAATLPNVVYAGDNLYTCSADTQEIIKQKIREHRLNRVVVASCTPRTHESLFRTTCREAALNPYLFEMANIRDQNTWVHMREPEKATHKAMDLVRMAVAKARLLEPLQNRFVPVAHDALVVGGGMSGMTAALELADQGFLTHLVERSAQLGGNMRHLHYLLEEGLDPQRELAATVARVLEHPKIALHTSASVVAVEGSIGNFKTTVRTAEGETTFAHGVVIVATGANPHVPDEYLYGKDPGVVTQRELEQALARPTPGNGHGGPRIDGVESVVMIQCVGSREPERPYCSRICCSAAIKNALRLKQLRPEAQVYVLYRDVRAYGFAEEHYRRAREAGVAFVKYEREAKPQVARDGARLTVTVQERVLGRTIAIPADLVVLSAGIVPDPASEELAKALKVPLSQDRFFLEAHMKLRPVDFATDGIFLCGLAHSPGGIRESVAQASAAASRAATILAKEQIELDGIVSQVVDENCDGCAYCVDPCPYHALTLIEYMRNGEVKKTVDRDIAVCKGCGVCQATCPKGGIVVNNFKLPQLVAMIHAALEA